MADNAARDFWVERVLGVDLSARATPAGRSDADVARAASAARAREGMPPPGRGVAYRKLLLRWREAQTTFDVNIKTLGAKLLARPEIKADPRIADIEKAVAELPKLVPKFGGQLEDVLDAGLNTADPAELMRLSKEGAEAIDAYRQQLAAASQLIELERFAANGLGASLPLHGALDEALMELKQQLAA